MSDPIRYSMTRLPKVLQPFLTWLTGQALPGQKPLLPNTAATQVASGFLMLIGGAAVAAGGTTMGLAAVPLILIGWTVMVGGARYLQTNIVHQAAHDRLTRHAVADRVIIAFASAVALIAPLDQYRAAHMEHHRYGTFATTNDPDFSFFRSLGFEGGLPKRELWRRLWNALCSPRTHARYLRVRLAATLVHAGTRHRLLTLGTQAGIATAMTIAMGLGAWLIAWAFPLIVLFQVSGLLQYLSEHVWLLQQRPDEPRTLHVNRLTVARFTGEAAPRPQRSTRRAFIAWLLWWTRMLTLYLFLRIFVLQGPLAVHDFHHRNPLHSRWPNSVYERQFQIESGDPRYRDYRGTWGLRMALNHSLDAMSQFPAETSPPDVDDDTDRKTFQTM